MISLVQYFKKSLCSDRNEISSNQGLERWEKFDYKGLTVKLCGDANLMHGHLPL
jgi:hypothetical protein